MHTVEFNLHYMLFKKMSCLLCSNRSWKGLDSALCSFTLHYSTTLIPFFFLFFPSLMSSPALGPLGCWKPREFASAGEGAHPAVPSVPVPAPARELPAPVWVRQPAGRSQLRTEPGDLCWTEKQLGKNFYIYLAGLLWEKKDAEVKER